jgi:hypothetical protein
MSQPEKPLVLCAWKPSLLAQSQSAQPPGVCNRRLVQPGRHAAAFGALLLGYYTDDGKLIYAGRVGTGISDKVLADLRRRLEPLSRAKSLTQKLLALGVRA